MGLFDKKVTCSVCGGKAKKDYEELKDGILCKKCLKNVSPWFSFEPETTLEQVRGNMELKEQMKAEEAAFPRDLKFGEGLQKLYIDKAQRRFMITDLLGHNPDIYSLDAIKSCELKTREGLLNTDQEMRTSLKREYLYTFQVVMTMDDPYVKQIPFEFKAKPVITGPTRLNDEVLEKAKARSETTAGAISNILSGLSRKTIDTIEANTAEGEAIIAELADC